MTLTKDPASEVQLPIIQGDTNGSLESSLRPTETIAKQREIEDYANQSSCIQSAVVDHIG
jgi:hypothetical protein